MAKQNPRYQEMKHAQAKEFPVPTSLQLFPVQGKNLKKRVKIRRNDNKTRKRYDDFFLNDCHKTNKQLNIVVISSYSSK